MMDTFKSWRRAYSHMTVVVFVILDSFEKRGSKEWKKLFRWHSIWLDLWSRGCKMHKWRQNRTRRTPEVVFSRNFSLIACYFLLGRIDRFLDRFSKPTFPIRLIHTQGWRKDIYALAMNSCPTFVFDLHPFLSVWLFLCKPLIYWNKTSCRCNFRAKNDLPQWIESECVPTFDFIFGYQ